MDQSIQKLLTDKVYDRRKQGALELEKLVRESVAAKDQERLKKIVHQLCHDYAYAIHAPYARNGGLIGLAAASIALGTDEVAKHLAEIVPPVLACFTDQDARVRYYACEAMYNISKVAKGEILPYFNDVFDALCKLAADSELAVKNGAELLDRLIKDIVSESAAHYVSILNYDDIAEGNEEKSLASHFDLPMAFSLKKFIPLLEERIHVANPFARTFLISWITLLDNIPDLDLAHYIPNFLGGLFKMLGDQNRDVFVAASGLLQKLLDEVVAIAKIKRETLEHRKERSEMQIRSHSRATTGSPGSSIINGEEGDNAIGDDASAHTDEYDNESGAEWIPGQDFDIDHAAILNILLKFIDPASSKDSDSLLRLEGIGKAREEEIGLIALKWIATFFEIASEDILTFLPRLLSQVLPALASQSQVFKLQAQTVNQALMAYVVTYHDRDQATHSSSPNQSLENSTNHSRQQSTVPEKGNPAPPLTTHESVTDIRIESELVKPAPPVNIQPTSDLDYTATVDALTLQFADVNEETRVAALSWLIMLHKKAPRKVLAVNDSTFPALLETLSDSSEHVVTRDLQLLSQIARNSDDTYFSSFIVSLLQLFSKDRRLLEIRGNLIIRQLCINLSPERIFRIIADCLERDEDIEFASIMVQNLNNNLLTAPELAELRKRLRNLDNKDGQAFFVALFKAWCHNAVATVSLCLLSQAYEQAYNLIQIFADLETTVNMLIQIDKLVQLLESPVFTFLRIQLLEPEKYPYLYKCLYGLLMLLPQSAAFAALKNRLNSVCNIALLNLHPQLPTSARTSVAAGMAPSVLPSGAASGTVSRLVGRREFGSMTSEVKWSELVERFKATQEKSRKRGEKTLSQQEEGEGVLSGSRPSGIPIILDKNADPRTAGDLNPNKTGRSSGVSGSLGKDTGQRSGYSHAKKHSMLGKLGGLARSSGYVKDKKDDKYSSRPSVDLAAAQSSTKR